MYDVSALGFGDNVVDKYEHIKTMYPGGNCVNFAVYAKMFGAKRSAYMGYFGNDAEASPARIFLQEAPASSASFFSCFPCSVPSIQYGYIRFFTVSQPFFPSSSTSVTPLI